MAVYGANEIRTFFKNTTAGSKNIHINYFIFPLFLVPPYLPPMRSLSQPPALNRNSEEYDSSGIILFIYVLLFFDEKQFF